MRQIEELYHSARECDPGERAAFLAQACRDDEELRRELDQLLAPESSSGNILDRPVVVHSTLDLLASSTVAQLSPGTKLGTYEILALIGKGGMGEVYKARDTRLPHVVAIKVSKTEFSERFGREARAIAALNHPHICTFHNIGPNYLVMEYIEGTPLKGPLPLEQALQYAAQICDALDAAHRKGITHRDLKPGNILVTRQGIKLLDFGLARMTPGENEPTLTRPGMVMGTPAYMAPEQREGKPGDARSDIYAFGCVLYEMLTGKRAARERVPVEPVALESVLGTCLEIDPEDRWQSARELKHALGWVAGQARGLPSPGHGPVPPRRSSVAWMMAAALAVVAAVALGTLLWRATQPMARPLMRFSTDLGPEAVEGANITTAISPDGTRLTFVARGPAGKQQLATRLLDQAQTTVLAGTENAANPFFSPDGQWIGFFADRKMKKISVLGGAAVTICDAPDARGASWGEDGFIFVTLSPVAGSGLSRVLAAGGIPQVITKPGEKGEATHRWPQILPGAQTVLFTGNTVNGAYNNASIEVVSLKSGQWKVVQRDGYFGRYVTTSDGRGHLMYLHEDTLFAVGFDLDRLEVRGTPVPVLEDVAGNAATGGGQYDVSRNGTLVYLSGKSSSATWPVAWMDSTGKTKSLLPTAGQYYMPRLSPDGNRLALLVRSAGDDGIQVYDWQRDTMTRLTFTQGNHYPVWTPDGRHIVFQSRSPSGYSIRWIRADGAGEPILLVESKAELRPYSFSPDGKRLAYSSFGLWTLSLDLSDPERPKPAKPDLFLRTRFDEQEPVFSPDGRWIANTSNESGRNEVHVRPFPTGAPSGSVMWQISTGGGRYPIWSHNGRELFYETPDGHIMVVAYSARAESFAAEKPRPWSNTQIREPAGMWNLDLAPDGKRFAMFLRGEAASEQKGSVHITFLLNFSDELQRKVPANK